MDVRKNKIARVVAQFSTEDLNAAYKDIVQLRDTGVCPAGKLRELELVVRTAMEAENEVFRHAEEYILMEMARRFYNITNTDDYASIQMGDPIYYLDSDSGEIEPGTVHGIYFKNGTVDTISVNFKDDFDEFSGTGLGKSLFRSKEAARAFWQNESQ